LKVRRPVVPTYCKQMQQTRTINGFDFVTERTLGLVFFFFKTV
jgi:hypothetical protein